MSSIIDKKNEKRDKFNGDNGLGYFISVALRTIDKPRAVLV